MEVKLLCEGYKNRETLFLEFVNHELWPNCVSDEAITIPGLLDIPDFPVYFGKMKDVEKVEGFLELVRTIEKYILSADRDVYMDERFWHSYLCLYKREFLLDKYPQIRQDKKEFLNIVLKPFDWENYIYKAVLAAQYVTDHVKSGDEAEKERYYQLILHNMDVFNYIIKYEIFRNSDFLVNVLDIIAETGLSKVLKARIKDRPDLGKDERYGRRIIFEFNKSYPIVLAPMLEKEHLKKYFLQYLSYYYKGEAADVNQEGLEQLRDLEDIEDFDDFDEDAR